MSQPDDEVSYAVKNIYTLFIYQVRDVVVFICNVDAAFKQTNKNQYFKIFLKTNFKNKVITNDGSDENMIRLITLKNIFAKQLPKMPKVDFF